MLQNVCRRKCFRTLMRYRIDIAEYLQRMSDDRVEVTCFRGRNIGTRIGPSGFRPLDTEFFHSRLQGGALESEVLGCAALSANLPIARHQHFFDV